MNNIKDSILNIAVKRLHEFGYPHCTKENIMVDEVYSLFFRKMLTDTLEESKNDTITKTINLLLEELPK